METKFSASNHERYEPAGTTHSQARKETWKTYFSRTAEHAGTLWWIAMMWWTRLLRNRPSRANRLKMNILRCLHFGKFISLRLVSVCVLSLARPFCVWEKKKKKKKCFSESEQWVNGFPEHVCSNALHAWCSFLFVPEPKCCSAVSCRWEFLPKTRAQETRRKKKKKARERGNTHVAAPRNWEFFLEVRTNLSASNEACQLRWNVRRRENY